MSPRRSWTASLLLLLLPLLLEASLCHAVAAFSLRFVPGFFKQSLDTSANTTVASSPPLDMGLVDGSTWADVYAANKSSSQKTKLIVLLRHGEGTHNVAIDEYGIDAWNSYLYRLPIFTDAPLTARGVAQARNASAVLAHEVKRGLVVDHVVVSPLDRTLATYATAFAELQSVPYTVVETAREMLGVFTCDRRRTITEKTRAFPQLDFQAIASDADVLWTATHRETDAEIDARAQALLTALFAEAAAASSTIAVVTHSLFAAACLRVLGHPPHALATAELLPLLIEDTAT